MASSVGSLRLIAVVEGCDNADIALSRLREKAFEISCSGPFAILGAVEDELSFSSSPMPSFFFK